MYGFVNCVKNLYQRNIIANHIWRDVKFIFKDQLKANCIEDEFKQQLKQNIVNELNLFLDAFQ